MGLCDGLFVSISREQHLRQLLQQLAVCSEGGHFANQALFSSFSRRFHNLVFLFYLLYSTMFHRRDLKLLQGCGSGPFLTGSGSGKLEFKETIQTSII